MKSTMGCLCCCFRVPKSEEPSALVNKDGSPATSPRKSYGAITTEEQVPEKGPPKPPRKSAEDLLYTEPPRSARVQSPDPVKQPEREKSPEPEILHDPVKSPEPDRVREQNGSGRSSDESGGSKGQKKTLVEIANMAKITKSVFQSARDTRTSTPNPMVDNDNNAQVEFDDEGAIDAPLIPTRGKTSPFGRRDSMESDTCHSIGRRTDEDEEESEDARILRMLPSVPSTSSAASGGSQTQLVPSTPSQGSSSHDVSKDSTGTKQSKAKDFMKKAGKNMKKAKKKVGKGVEKMLTHKKKEEETGKDKKDTKDRADSLSANENSSSAQFKRVSSERMKSKYARDKLAALEKKREEEASQKGSNSGFTDPRQAALERGEKLSELEDKTEQMRDTAASFAHNVSMLKNQHGSTS